MSNSAVKTSLASENFALGYVEPDMWPEVALQTPALFQNNLYMTLKALGREEAHHSYSMEHGEAPNWIEPLYGAAAGSAAGLPGATVSWLLPAPAYDSFGNIAFEVRDTFRFTNGVIAELTSITGAAGAWTVFLTPKETTESIPAITALQKIMKLDNQNAENSTFRTGLVPKVDKFTNEMQIFMQSYVYSGTSASVSTWWNMGEGKKSFVPYQKDVNQLSFTKDINYSFMFGGGTGDNAGANDRRSTALIPFIQSGGNNLPVAGNIQLSDFRTMNNLFQATMGSMSKRYMCRVGFVRMAQIEDMAANAGQVWWEPTVKRELDMGFKSLKIGGYEYSMATDDSLNTPNATGLPGYDYNKMIIMIPDGLTQNTISGKMTPLLSIGYLSANGNNRRFQSVYQGPAELGQDGEKYTFISECGLRPMVSGAFGIITA